MNYREQLLEMINSVINGTWTVPQFEERYYMFYSDSVPDDALTDNDRAFFSAVNEKLDYTVENPPKDDRQYGYVNYQEFVEWLRKTRDVFCEEMMKSELT